MAEFVKVFILILRGSEQKLFRANKKVLHSTMRQKNYLFRGKIFLNNNNNK